MLNKISTNFFVLQRKKHENSFMYGTEWFYKSWQPWRRSGFGDMIKNLLSPIKQKRNFFIQSWETIKSRLLSNLQAIPESFWRPCTSLMVWNISPLNVLFVYSNLFSWGRIIFATLIHDSTHARLVFRICALNSGQSCLSCPMWISISRKLATWVLISISICKIVCEWFMSQKILSRENMWSAYIWQIWLIKFHRFWYVRSSLCEHMKFWWLVIEIILIKIEASEWLLCHQPCWLKIIGKLLIFSLVLWWWIWCGNFAIS